MATNTKANQNEKNVGGRPPLNPNEPTVFVGCKMVQSLATDLDRIAAQLGLTNRSELVRVTLADFVNNFKRSA